ncbi:(S)-2-haloacid dehalogenase 4A [Roseivivax jejudonensis]|uniref:(S)-2-haloacid dehalogenase n=1 Tax=Roseivivax jejudonensis TaxID=1529041 RepID=A0A1X6Y875_9RHOB|nr:haloacid dehalogenase type II [Roseivivax jejudonensis]SLN13313.1 (S)-2-haloacid dehalogenase 4A [Roseivivax jejudonensis]
MPDRRHPSILVFDVNETLLDLTTLEPLFDRVFGDAAVMREWFAQLILYSEALTLSEIYTHFSDLAAGTLRMVGETSGHVVTEDDVDELKERIGTMPAHPDVAPALERLQAEGFRLVTLTNSPPGPSPTALERTNLARYFERSFSVNDVGYFKPAPKTYRLVAEQLGVEMSDMCLVACHFWDTLGAQAAGCTSAFVKRPGNAELLASGVPVPDIIADDMHELVQKIIEKWARRPSI